jgi:hypothetical protein
VSDLLGPDPMLLPDGLAIPAEDWQQTPTSVQYQFFSLLKRVEALAARLNRDSANNSRRPLSTESAAKKRRRRATTAERRTPGAKLGHRGHPPVLWEPTSSVSLWPAACTCGHGEFKVGSELAYTARVPAGALYSMIIYVG